MRSEQEVNNEVEDIKKVEGKEEEHKEELDKKDLHKGEEEKEEDMEDVSMRRWVTVGRTTSPKRMNFWKSSKRPLTPTPRRSE